MVGEGVTVATSATVWTILPNPMCGRHYRRGDKQKIAETMRSEMIGCWHYDDEAIH